MFGVDRFDAILPPGTVSIFWFKYDYVPICWILHKGQVNFVEIDLHDNVFLNLFMQGAIMAVGASEPTVVATKDGRIGLKNQMQVNSFVMTFLIWYFLDSVFINNTEILTM